MKREVDKIFPGNGACELCGEVDPCSACVGAPQAPLSMGAQDGCIFEPTQSPGLIEKVNSIFTSIIKKQKR